MRYSKAIEVVTTYTQRMRFAPKPVNTTVGEGNGPFRRDVLRSPRYTAEFSACKLDQGQADGLCTRQLRFLHLQPRPVFGRTRGESRGSPQPPGHGSRH